MIHINCATNMKQYTERGNKPIQVILYMCKDGGLHIFTILPIKTYAADKKHFS